MLSGGVKPCIHAHVLQELIRAGYNELWSFLLYWASPVCQDRGSGTIIIVSVSSLSD